MAAAHQWRREDYERSVTSRAWAATPYDAGWEESRRYGEDLPASVELRAIFDEEMALAGGPPAWAEDIVDRMIGTLPMCGHYAFPLPLVRICEAVGARQAPEFVHGCYTADPERKVRMSYCIYCLDAWLKDAPLEVAQAELGRRDDLGGDWRAIAGAVYRALGPRSEAKELAVRRLTHRLRWWVKTHIWPGDRRDRFMLDMYGGDVRGHEARYGCYGNAGYGDPYFAELGAPEVKAMDERIRATVPDGGSLVDQIHSTWLCAPKAFRYVEKIIIRIGGLDRAGAAPETGPVLHCEDTLPDVAANGRWYAAFTASLDAWLDGDAEARPELGDVTPARHWLVRLLFHKLRLFEKHDPFGRLVGVV